MAVRKTSTRTAAASTGYVTFTCNDGVPEEGSSHGRARFLDVEGALPSDRYRDDEIAGLLASGAIVRYAEADGMLVPASVIGENVAVNLFIGGAGEIEDPVGNHDESRTVAAILPVMGILLGGKGTPGVVDFRCAGMLWALTGYALGKEYMYQGDMDEVAVRLYEAALAAENGGAPVDPAMVFAGRGSPPARIG